MAKLLVLATGPLLEAGVGLFGAHGLRTWHLTRPLLDAGHEVRLFTIPMYDPADPSQRTAGVVERSYQGFAYHAFTNCDDRHNIARLEEEARRFSPDALIGVNAYPCAVLAKVNFRAPLWADLNGSATIEGQIKARNDASDALLGHAWEMEKASLRRADRFSTVSERQMYLLCGQLSAVGRMNRHTFDYPFASVIPNAFNPVFTDSAAARSGTLRIRGGLVPEDAFVLLWSGGYNAWTDYAVLQRALEMAMEACPRLHYVATGGPVAGHDDVSYPRFRESLARSPFAARFHLLGWIDAGELPGVMAQSDLGIQVDAPNFETLFGARNRTINMMAAGLPVLTTPGAEISDELIAAGCVASPGARSGAEALAREIIALYEDRDRLRDLAERGRRYVLEHFSYERTTRPLLEWATSPGFAPDNQARLELAGADGEADGNPFAFPLNPIEELVTAGEAALWERRLSPEQLDEHRNRYRSPLQKLVRRLIGPERYARLRALRRRS